jgi:hypothetical protein
MVKAAVAASIKGWIGMVAHLVTRSHFVPQG